MTVTALPGFVFSLATFLALEFVTREQFPNSEGQEFADLVTLCHAIASLILALIIINYHLRGMISRDFHIYVMCGYALAFSIFRITNVI